MLAVLIPVSSPAGYGCWISREGEAWRAGRVWPNAPASKAVRGNTHEGSNPSPSAPPLIAEMGPPLGSDMTGRRYGPVAQLVARLLHTEMVAGSSPAGSTRVVSVNCYPIKMQSEATQPVLKIGMVTTTDRADERQRTLASLGQKDIEVYEDLRPGLRRNHMAAWQSLFADPDVTHGLLFQDDVRAPQGWREVVDHFLEVFPGQYAISLYSGRKAASQPASTTYGHFMLPARQWLNEQALLLRREVIVGFNRWLLDEEYMDVVSPEDVKHHDVLMGAFLASRGEKVMCAAPSLFQHSDAASTVGHPGSIGGRPRKAVEWPGEDWDAGEHFRQNLRPRNILADRTRRM